MAAFGHFWRGLMLLAVLAGAVLLPAYWPQVLEQFTGITPDLELRVGCLTGDSAVVRQALAAGASCDALDDSGQTAVYWAISSGRPAMLREVLAHRPHLGVADRAGMTPLLHAILLQNPEMVRLLLEAGSDAYSACPNGQTPLGYAQHIQQAMQTPEAARVIALLERGPQRPFAIRG
jgi:hypothetical protein